MGFLSRALTCVVLALLCPLVMAQGYSAKFDPQRDAARDLVAAQTEARATGKRVMVDVGGEWCRWCRMLDRVIASQPQIRAFMDSKSKQKMKPKRTTIRLGSWHFSSATLP
jgi:thiol:disulfide interchange protein